MPGINRVFITDFGTMRDAPRWAISVIEAAPLRKDLGYDMRFRVSRTAARAHRLMNLRALRRYQAGGFSAVAGVKS